MVCEDPELEVAIFDRMRSRIDLDQIVSVCGSDIVIAGGALLAHEPNDYDIYSANQTPLSLSGIQARVLELGWRVVSTTQNALTVQGDLGKVYQFCTYAKKNPDRLIESFDFAHCQIGLVASSDKRKGNYVVLTEAFLRAMALERTFYCGSEYPLSSLIRLVKYAKRGLYGDCRAHMNDVIRILTDILNRGFYDHDDLRDQLDAIDLNYVGEEAKALWDSVEKTLIKPRPAPEDDYSDCPF